MLPVPASPSDVQGLIVTQLDVQSPPQGERGSHVTHVFVQDTCVRTPFTNIHSSSRHLLNVYLAKPFRVCPRPTPSLEVSDHSLSTAVLPACGMSTLYKKQSLLSKFTDVMILQLTPPTQEPPPDPALRPDLQTLSPGLRAPQRQCPQTHLCFPQGLHLLAHTSPQPSPWRPGVHVQLAL